MTTSVASTPLASSSPAVDPLLALFRAALDDLYGDRIERVVLFGSRARGDFHQQSDYDVAVFLKTMPDRWNDIRLLARLSVDFMDETGAIFSSKPLPAGSHRDRTPIMSEIRRDGHDF